MEKYAFIAGAWGDTQVSLKEVEKTGIKKIIAAHLIVFYAYCIKILEEILLTFLY